MPDVKIYRMKKANTIGLLYFIIHFLIEITSYYVVFSYYDSEYIVLFALVYDTLAFVPESLYGMINDIGIKIDFDIVGGLIAFAAVVMMFFGLPPVLIVVTVAVGNGMIHVQGAEMTLRTSSGKMFPSALFVSGGAFGVAIGRILALSKIPIWIVLLTHLLMIIPIILVRIQKIKLDFGELKEFEYATPKRKEAIVIFLATFVVIVRSYMGYVIPAEWNDNSYLSIILLFSSMAIGKAVGGYLIDKVGMWRTIIISTFGSLPFLIIGNTIISLSLIGLLLFSMTMAVALGLIVSVMKNYPGVGFGFTTIGLFLGALISAFIIPEGFLGKSVLVTVLTVISFFFLKLISRKEGKSKI